MKRFLIIAALACLWSAFVPPALLAQVPPEFDTPNCLDLPGDRNLTLFGDSRMVTLFTRDGMFGYVRDAAVEVPGAPGQEVLILAPGSVRPLHNMGWAGSKATHRPVRNLFLIAADDPILAAALGLLAWDPAYDPRSERVWSEQLRSCADRGAPYVTAENVVLHLGGNDMKDFYDDMERLEPLYLWLRLLTEPKSLVADWFAGRDLGPDELSWWWAFQVKELEITQAVAKLVDHHLGEGGNAEQLLLVAPAPIFGDPLGDGTIDFRKTVRLFFYFGSLETHYAVLSAVLKDRHGVHRVHFTSMFWEYLGNILEGGSYYYPGGDGIHFNEAGDRRFGQLLASRMGQIGWFELNPDLPGVGGSPEEIQAMLVINQKAAQVGVPFHVVLGTPLGTVPGGYKKDFPGGLSVYLKDGAAEAWEVHGAIHGRYLLTGGPSGPLGFPVSDEMATGPFGIDRVSLFECGQIWWLAFPGNTGVDLIPGCVP